MQEDFPDLNPLIPTHYFRLARRCFAAMADPQNQGKVRLPYWDARWHAALPS
jgi:hypothetical protein